MRSVASRALTRERGVTAPSAQETAREAAGRQALTEGGLQENSA
jgi:hypothetical protein